MEPAAPPPAFGQRQQNLLRKWCIPVRAVLHGFRMNVVESITSFFRRVDLLLYMRSRPPSFWGQLDGNVVQSGKPVIVFERPKILMEADSVEEATTFLVKEHEAHKGQYASVYQFDTNYWRRVPIRRKKPSPPPEIVLCAGHLSTSR